MAEEIKVIRVGDILTNLIDPVTKLSVQYSKVLNWYDGTPMTDTKLDSYGIYVKKGSEYFLKSLGEYGQILQKNTMTEMRNLSGLEILLLRMGYYNSVQLNGYYQEGDTPAPIQYYLSSTTEVDDGGSVFEVGGIKLEHDFGKHIDIRYFGAKGDSINDDTDSVKNVAKYAKGVSRPPVVFVPEGFSFRITDTIEFDLGIDVIMESPFTWYGEMDRPCLVIGRDDARNYHRKFKLNVSATNRRSDWEDDNYIGVLLKNFYSCEIFIVQASFFTRNVICLGDGSGFVYNNVFITDIGHGKIGLLLYSKNAGWCNENNWFGGRFQSASQINRGKSRYGIVLKSEDEYRQNNNVFYKPSLELNDSAARDIVRDPETNQIISIGNPDGEAVPILIENGRHNEFISIRDEGNTYTVKTDNDSHNNYVQAGFSSVFARYDNRVKDVGEYPSTIFTTNIQKANQTLGWPILSIPNILEYVKKYSPTNVHCLSPLRLQNSESLNPTYSVSGVSVQNGYVEIDSNSGLGFRINTSLRKRFNVAISYTDINYSGRIVLIPRDENNNIIPIEDANTTTIIKISGRYEKFLSSKFGGGIALGTGISATRDLGNVMQFFAVSEEVKTVDVFFVNYQGNARLKGFQLYSLDGFCDIIPYSDFDNKIAISPPDDITYNGDFVLSVSTNQLGWKLSGGSWREVGGAASPALRGEVLQVASSADTATQAAGATPTKAEFDALLAELRDLKTKMRAGDAPILSS